MPDAASRFARVKALFNEVADLADAATQRTTLEAKGTDSETIAEVMRLLGASGQTTRIGAPVAQAATRWLAESSVQPGDVLGAWTLLRPLGQGGMGRVFLAERSDGHYRQNAAIKLLLGWTGSSTQELLARERQILAHLNHPHIARLLDGGTTSSGQPYLVMEYIDGAPIDRWCAAKQLGLAARLALFMSVCEAVAHAHRQLVIHCDIKPSNVLVNPEGRAILLDFGISHLEGQEEVSQHAMTPGFSSPEQSAGLPPGIPSDIYSLGRLLAVLVEPIANTHGRGAELNAIIAHATAESPEQRYDAAGSLQRDLQRLLEHRPVEAMGNAGMYVFRKTLRRHWAWSLAGIAAIALTAGFTWRLDQERKLAEAESQRAQIEVATTNEVSRLLMSLFTGADPKTAGDIPDPPKDLVFKGRERLEEEMQKQGVLRARLLVVLGDVYENIHAQRDAISAYREAASLFAKPDVAQPIAEADALRRLALVLTNSGQLAEAVTPARRALELRERYMPDDTQALADAENRLAIVLTNLRRFDEARPRLERALRLRVEGIGPDDPDTTSTLHNLARLNRLSGNLEEADKQFRKVLATTLHTIGAHHWRRLGSMENHAATLSEMQRHDEAESTLRETVQAWTEAFGGDNTNVAVSRGFLGRALREAGKFDLALAETKEALRIETAADPAPRVTLVSLHMDMARVHEDAGRLSAAETEWRHAMEIAKVSVGVSDLTWAIMWHGLARTLDLAGQQAKARPWLARARAVRDAQLGARDSVRLESELLDVSIDLAEPRPNIEQATTRLADIESRLASNAYALRGEAQRLHGRIEHLAGHAAEAAHYYSEVE